MGRFVYLIFSPLIFAAVFFLTMFGAVVKFGREQDEQEQEPPKVTAAADPEDLNDDVIRREMIDKSAVDRLETVADWAAQDAALVGALPEPIEVWHAKRVARAQRN